MSLTNGRILITNKRDEPINLLLPCPIEQMAAHKIFIGTGSDTHNASEYLKPIETQESLFG